MTIVHLVLLWCLGIWLALSVDGEPWLWTIRALLAAAAMLLFRRRRRHRFVAACVLALCAGGVRATLARPTVNIDWPDVPSGGNEVVVTGVVSGEPQIRERTVELTLDVESLRREGGPQRATGDKILVTVPRYPVLAYGMRLRVRGKLEEPENRSDFDYRAYLMRQGIQRVMRFPEVEILSEKNGSPFYRALLTVKDQARATISRLIPEPEGALLTGILLGDDSGLPPDLEEDFRKTGMTHIIAISGFNVAILAGVLMRAGRAVLDHRFAAWGALAGILLYTILVGADASVVRAAIMGSILVVTHRLLGRPIFAPAALFVAVFFMTLGNPHILWQPGFQLSFAATLGLMLYAEPFSRRISGRLQRWLEQEWVARHMPFFSETVLATLSAQILALPLLAYHFGQVSLASLPANLLILPAQPAVMVWGGLATIVGMVLPAVGQVLAWVAWLFLAYTISLVRILANLPLAAVDLIPGPLTVMAIYVLILAITWFLCQREERRQEVVGQLRARAALGALALALVFLPLAWVWLQTQPDGRLHVFFLDVGQGDATLVQTPGGRQILVDGGRYPTLLNAEVGRRMPFWDRQVDAVIATHPDDDHVADLPGMLNRYALDLLLTNGSAAGASNAYKALFQECEEDGVEVRQVRSGEIMDLGDGVRLEFLHPGQEPLQGDNDNSVALRLVYEGFSLLLTGDAELAGERAILETGLPVESLVLKAGHHGSRTSSSDFFLETVRPRIVVVSAGKDNQAGHPHPEMLQRAADAGATVLRTDELGTIEVVTDGERMWWEAGR